MSQCINLTKYKTRTRTNGHDGHPMKLGLGVVEQFKTPSRTWSILTSHFSAPNHRKDIKLLVFHKKCVFFSSSFVKKKKKIIKLNLIFLSTSTLLKQFGRRQIKKLCPFITICTYTFIFLIVLVGK